MMHPHTELRFINAEIGVGVFATKFIPKGTIVWVLDDWDIRISKETLAGLDAVRLAYLNKYAYEGDDGGLILNWDHARYMNHSFRPNCVDTAYELELAARDIYPGEQLTADYGAMGADEDFICIEEGVSRTRVRADDYVRHYQEWDAWAHDAFQHFNQVEQPLLHLVQPEFSQIVQAVADGRRPLDSILTVFTAEEE